MVITFDTDRIDGAHVQFAGDNHRGCHAAPRDRHNGAPGAVVCLCQLGDLEIDEDEIEAVLHRIQNFDPPGVGARDLKENLLLTTDPGDELFDIFRCC